MNRQEFEDTARRYREEMFRMYASQSIEPKPKPEPPAAVPVQQTVPEMPRADLQQNMQQSPQKTLPPPEQQTVPEPPPTPQEPQTEEPQNPPQEQPPEPDGDKQPAAPQQKEQPADPFVPEPELPKRAYTGIIRIHVFTAQGALPVAGAAVTVTRTAAGRTDLIALQITDQSGSVSPLTVPAPPPSEDQRSPAYFVYDIAVQASGYYREQSTDVPVFPNVTSVQSFDLIPLPAGGDDSGSITYYNSMQQY